MEFVAARLLKAHGSVADRARKDRREIEDMAESYLFSFPAVEEKALTAK
jgi:hypothetical protein